MLPKYKRLSTREVREVLKRGKSARKGAVMVRYTMQAQSKAAVVVSGKIAKRAVERNRVRRKGYAALTDLPAQKHVVFFIQSKEFNPADLKELCLKLS